MTPDGADRLIGRERELAELGDVLNRSATRLVTIWGPPGIGKTRLALELARNVEARLPVFFCPLAASTTDRELTKVVSQSLGLSANALRGDVDRVSKVARALANRGPMLLVLDNVEQGASRGPSSPRRAA